MDVRKMQVGMIGAFALVATTAGVLDYNSFQKDQETVTATVVNKERVCTADEDGDVSCTNYIHTESETFVNDPVLWAGKFDATALQGRIVPGETYQFRVYGQSSEAFGVFRKIIVAGEILPGGGTFGGGGSKNW